MSFLLDDLPRQVKIGGHSVDINSDFRVFIRFEALMSSDLAADEKLGRALELFYNDKIADSDIEEAVNELLRFYNGGNAVDKSDTENDSSFVNNVFDYEYDSDYIFAAFLQQYRIDLELTPYMHWWKFRALFKSLDENTEFVKILVYRSIKITSDMSEREQAFYRKMKERYALPLPIEEQEKLDSLAAALKNGQSVAELLQ